MTNTDEVTDGESAQTATLRRVGRNLVNAQRIELMLKFLLQVNFSAPMREFEALFKKHVTAISRKTLGVLIPEVADSVFLIPDASHSKREITEVWLTTSFNFPLDAEALGAWDREWETLRTERNKLVHLMLGNVDFNSPEQCRKLDLELDAQNALFLNGIAFLGPMVTATKKAIAEMASEQSKA